MTRSRKLKRAIRQRARKTGERYTAARRQVLISRGLPEAKPKTAAPALPPPPRTTTRGGISESAVLEKTGHGLEHWFGVLDALGAPAGGGHTDRARHLYEAHGVPGWHAQGIAVAYERARGLRAVNQACDGTFQVSVSRVVPASVAEVVGALSERAQRERWLREADARLARALADAFEGPKPREVKVKDASYARLRYPWAGSTVEIRITAKPAGGASVAADNMNLRDAAEVESRRALWKVALDGLRRHLDR